MTLSDVIRYANGQGGGTFRPGSLEPIETDCGYAVSLHGSEYQDYDLDERTLQNYLDMYPLLKDSESGVALGLWRNPDGLWFYDLTTLEPDLVTAMEYARQQEQIGIYDFRLKEVVYVPTED